MEYKILAFQPDYRIVQSYINYDTIIWSDISKTPCEEEYDYQGFENESDAIEKICNHAAEMMKKLYRENDLTALEALARDYRNAIKCTINEKGYENTQIVNFTEYMLNHDWKTTVAVINEAYEDNQKTEEKNWIESSCLPFFEEQFVNKADHALFIDGNYIEAIKEYTVASYEWKCRYTSGYSNQIKVIPVGEKHKIKKYINLWSAIQEGKILTIDYSFLCERERIIMQKYGDIVKKYNNHESIIDEAEELITLLAVCFKMLQPRKQNFLPHPIFSMAELNTLRLIRFLEPKLFEMVYLDEVELLSYESDAIQDGIKNNVIDKVKSLYYWNDNVISFAFNLLVEDEDQWSMLKAIARVQKDVTQIKKQLLIRENTPDMAYYTTWKTFSYMLPKDDGNREDNAYAGKLSVMNHTYMNDPMEGEVLSRYIFGDKAQNGRKTVTKPYVFIKCFTQSIDYLPMWKMYGGEAKGCCIVIDWEQTKRFNMGKEISIYRVCYLSKNNKKYYYNKEDNKDINYDGMDTLLENLKKDCEQLARINNGIYLFDYLVSTIAYLFKDSSYSYEKEARVLYSLSKTNSSIQKTNEEPPKLFVYTDYAVAIKEIILGPKFEDTYLWTPYIQSQIEKMNDITNNGRMLTILSLSDINFR